MPAIAPPRPSGAPPAFHLLAKPTGAACNLDCAYCFFLDKEALDPGSKFRMSDLTYAAQFLETFHEFQPRMKPASFSIDQVLAKMEQGFDY